MIRRPPRSTRTDTLVPYTTLFRSLLIAFAARRALDRGLSLGYLEAQLRLRFGDDQPNRSEEHTSELQSLMRISYAVFCLTKKINNIESVLVRNTYTNVHQQCHYSLEQTIH